MCFLAVQDSSIDDLVTDSLSQVLISATSDYNDYNEYNDHNEHNDYNDYND